VDSKSRGAAEPAQAWQDMKEERHFSQARSGECKRDTHNGPSSHALPATCLGSRRLFPAATILVSCGPSSAAFSAQQPDAVTSSPERIDLMRLEAAWRALKETALPLKIVAVQSGYGDEQKLRRAFQRQLGSNPATIVRASPAIPRSTLLAGISRGYDPGPPA